MTVTHTRKLRHYQRIKYNKTTKRNNIHKRIPRKLYNKREAEPCVKVREEKEKSNTTNERRKEDQNDASSIE
jgi:hypothetical protein